VTTIAQGQRSTAIEDQPLPADPWHPIGVEVAIPNSQTAVRQRLVELAELQCPTLAEQAELELLARWFSERKIRDTRVLHLTAARLGLTELLHNIPCSHLLVPVYEAARSIWADLQRLAEGETLPAPRPRKPNDGLQPPRPETTVAIEDWYDHQREQLVDWFRTVMWQLEELIESGVIGSSDAAGLVTGQLCQTLRQETVRELFDSPFSFGHSLFMEPYNPGTSLGDEGQAVWMADALAAALAAAVAAMNAATDPREISRWFTHVDLFWMWLKGFLMAAVKSGAVLPSAYVTMQSEWQRVAAGIPAALEAMGNALPRVGLVLWTHHGRPLTMEAAGIPIDEIVARMNLLIAQARKDQEFGLR